LLRVLTSLRRNAPGEQPGDDRRGASLRVCEVRGMTLVVEPAAEEDDGVASPHGSLADP
jgi:hypothetical protein